MDNVDSDLLEKDAYGNLIADSEVTKPVTLCDVYPGCIGCPIFWEDKCGK